MRSDAGCAVCGDRHHGLHFGVLSCRACSSFWRRSLVERKSYKCRAEGHCDISMPGMRNACRACRLEMCKRAGMKGEVPSADIHESPSGSEDSPKSDGFLAKPQLFAIPSTSSELDRALVGYRNFCSAQRSLYIVENPNAIFCNLRETDMRPITRSEHLRMERGTIALLHSLLLDSSALYQSLGRDQRVQLMRSFSFQFVYLHRSYMTAQIFPQPDDPRFCLHYGYFFHQQHMEFFFEGSDTVREQVQFARGLMAKAMNTTNMFRSMQLTELEFMALAATLYKHTVNELGIEDEEGRGRMDAINNEIFYHVALKYGLSNAGARLGRLHELVHDVVARCIELRDSLVVARIFFTDPQSDVWEDFQLPDDDQLPSRPLSNNPGANTQTSPQTTNLR